MNSIRTSHPENPLSIDQLPGPKGLPFLGNAHQLSSQSLHLKLEEWARRYGPVYTFKVGSKRVLVSSDTEINYQALKMRPQVFSRFSRVEPIAKDLHLLGVFAAEGEDWKRQRYVVMQGFANKNLRQFFPVIQEVTRRLEKKWLKKAQESAWIDVQEELMRFTVDVTTHLAFGYPMNTIEQEHDAIQEHLEHIFPTLQRRLFVPFDYWKYAKLPADYKVDRALREILTEISAFIDQARAQLEAEPELREHPQNFLQALLIAKDEEGRLFSEEEIVANVFTILLGGEDTTANTIAWLLYYLAKHPKLQQQLQEEVDPVLKTDSILPSIESAKELPFLEAIMHETLRLKPVAPVIFLTAVEDVQLKNLSIPKGTDFLALTRIPVLDTKLFEGGSDFCPHQWMQSDSPHAKIKGRAYIPFGTGPRLCPGRNLAYLEIKMVVAMIASSFQLSLRKPEESVKEIMAFSLMPKQLQINLHPRKRG